MKTTTEKLLNESQIGDIAKDTPYQVSRTAEYTVTSIVTMIFFVYCIRVTHQDNLLKSAVDVGIMTSLFYLTMAICGLLIRVCNFFAEIQFIDIHYDSQLTNVLKATFDFNGPSLCLTFVCLMALSAYSVKEGNPVVLAWSHGPFPCFLAFALSYILIHVVDLNETKHMTARTIRSMAGADYGGGMAFSYFYGYLKIILPGLRKKMEIYEGEQGVTIPVKKMFILIPRSGHIPPDLCDASHQWLEGTTNLEHIVTDRAGVKRRNYKNTVYKIHPNGLGKGHRPIYVVTEGATPMLTFWEILSHDHRQTATFKQNKMQIISAFYKVLSELIDNDPECQDVCELIYYKDYENGSKINVAEILLNRIQVQASLS